MNEKWKFNRFRDPLGVLGVVFVWLLLQNLSFCWCLNDEGLALLRFRERVVSDPFGALANWNDEDGEVDPCSWFGVECSDGKVVVLNLKNLCLEGTLSPELRNLVHIKSIILRNNSFTEMIPVGIGELKELEVLDLGYNNFSGPLPVDLGSNFSLTILLLENNRFLGILSPEIFALEMLSQHQVDENQLSGATRESSCNERSNSWSFVNTEHSHHVRLLEVETKPSTPNQQSLKLPEKSPEAESTNDNPPPTPSPDPSSASPPSASSPSPLPGNPTSKNSSNHDWIMPVAIGGGASLVILFVGVYFYACNKVATVKPWATGLSGQLQKSFVTGVPNLRRSEIQAACEDFSNVIGTSSPMGTVYKGTLSSGVEIVVASLAAKSASNWSNNLELQFRNKIETLTKVNHKNFVNIIGYCKEEEPFTRMMVFEYAPNGTLFEHLHIREAERLDWKMRMRIAMGMAYCLEHMHQLTPPIAHNSLTSSAVLLTEDYAPKVSEVIFWNELAEAEKQSSGTNAQSTSLESNVYSFGAILFELVTGRLPYSVDNGSQDWAFDYLRGEGPFTGMVDPTLESFDEEQLEKIREVIRACVHPVTQQRPRMRDIAARLREITGVTSDAASSKLSPLWWAELEVMPQVSN